MKTKTDNNTTTTRRKEKRETKRSKAMEQAKCDAHKKNININRSSLSSPNQGPHDERM
jgi:hypothetical protein